MRVVCTEWNFRNWRAGISRKVAHSNDISVSGVWRRTRRLQLPVKGSAYYDKQFDCMQILLTHQYPQGPAIFWKGKEVKATLCGVDWLNTSRSMTDSMHQQLRPTPTSQESRSYCNSNQSCTCLRDSFRTYECIVIAHKLTILIA